MDVEKTFQHRTEGLRPLEEIEKDAILEALEASDGNKSEAARILGINRKTLHKKLKTYDMEGNPALLSTYQKFNSQFKL